MEKQGSGKVFMYLPVEFSTDPGCGRQEECGFCESRVGQGQLRNRKPDRRLLAV